MNLRLPLLRCALCLALFLALACEKTSTAQTAPESPGQQSRGGGRSPMTTVRQSPTPLPSTNASPGAEAGQTPSPDLANLESRVRPAVIWVTVFDSKGNLLRTASGFFISADGRFITTARAIEGGVNAVAKTADGGIYNVSGILRASKELDLAVLQAEVKPNIVFAVGEAVHIEHGAMSSLWLAADKGRMVRVKRLQ